MQALGTLIQAKGIGAVAENAAGLEAAGADIIGMQELGTDPLMYLAMAATSTEKARMMSNIVVAFGRSPLALAQQAHDLHELSGGRLILGIGSQVKPHIEKRYSMPWSKPAARMREYVQALKAIWACWYEDAALDFRGEFYQHTLMPPMFKPNQRDFVAPLVYVAAVGPMMTEVAAEVADGILLHPFTTPEYINAVTMPAIERGLQKSGRRREDFHIVGAPFLVTGDAEEAFKTAVHAARGQLAFYGSTPPYKPVLDSVGYGELQPELLRMSQTNRWAEMAGLIDDGLLEKLALVGDPADIQKKLTERYAGIFDSCTAMVFMDEGYEEGYFDTQLANIIRES